LTSGQLRGIPKIQEQYCNIKARKGKFYNKHQRLDPIEDDSLPTLVRFKPYLLMNRLMAIYPQKYSIVDDCKSNAGGSISGKRKAGVLMESTIREINYKRKFALNPLPFITKNGLLNLATPTSSGTNSPGRRKSSFCNMPIVSNQYSILIQIHNNWENST
jgi:hypothetical protein